MSDRHDKNNDMNNNNETLNDVAQPLPAAATANRAGSGPHSEQLSADYDAGRPVKQRSQSC